MMKSKSIHQWYIYIYIGFYLFFYFFNHLATSIIQHNCGENMVSANPWFCFSHLAYFHWGKTNFWGTFQSPPKACPLPPPNRNILFHIISFSENQRGCGIWEDDHIYGNLAYPPQNSQSRPHHPMLWSICT